MLDYIKIRFRGHLELFALFLTPFSNNDGCVLHQKATAIREYYCHTDLVCSIVLRLVTHDTGTSLHLCF